MNLATIRTGDTTAAVLVDPERGFVRAEYIWGTEHLISFHSQVMPLYPGDVISTATPGAVQIRPGHIARCRIEGSGTLSNPVAADDRGAHV